jgi:sulfotransferase family protein
MIVNPVIIVGAPRSGTSLLQKIIRAHPAFWSLPSESEIIWDEFCHPRLRNWESDCLQAEDLTQQAREKILRQFELYSLPARVWRSAEKTNLIWSFKRLKLLRALFKTVYTRAFPLLRKSGLFDRPKRLVEKTINNCLRLGYVDAVFPDAKFIYQTRDGRSNINSIINSWRNPSRFFSYDLPVTLKIDGYQFKKWNFGLPPGWRDYIDQPLERVCAYQWTACHQSILAETEKPNYKSRVLQIKLEDLAANPRPVLQDLAGFIDVEFDDYFEKLARDLPIVNSPDNNIDTNKWQHQNASMIEKIIPVIEPTMKQLGYEV